MNKKGWSRLLEAPSLVGDTDVYRDKTLTLCNECSDQVGLHKVLLGGKRRMMKSFAVTSRKRLHRGSSLSVKTGMLSGCLSAGKPGEGGIRCRQRQLPVWRYRGLRKDVVFNKRSFSE